MFKEKLPTVVDLSKMSRRERYELAALIISAIDEEWSDSKDTQKWQDENVVEYEASMSFDELAAEVRAVNFKA